MCIRDSIHAAEKRLALFPVFWACVHLIHKAVFRSVEFCGQVGHLPQKALDVRKIFRRSRHKVVLHLCHTMGGGLNDDTVLVAEVIKQVSVGHPAGIRQHFQAGAFQPVFTENIKAGFQKCDAPLWNPSVIQRRSPPGCLIDQAVNQA